jgi:hypothetical protein
MTKNLSDLDPNSTLTDHAHSLLVEALQSPAFGSNVLSVEHKAALRLILLRMTQMAYGVRVERLAIPLGTGLGKSTSVLYWLKAANDLGLLGKDVLKSEEIPGLSVAVCCSRILALNELRRDLVAAGVPAGLVSVYHSEGTGENPVDVDGENRPILLTTHANTKGNRPQVLTGYLGEPRSFVIWDENMQVSKATAVRWDDFHYEMPSLLAHGLAHGSEASKFLTQAHAILSEDLGRQACGLKPFRLQLPEFNPAKVLEELREAESKLRRKNAVAPAVDVVKMALSAPDLRLLRMENGNAVITYRIEVPRELRSILVLDASSSINELRKLDPTIRLETAIRPDLKRYDNVSMKWADSGSGRSSVTTDLKKRGRSFFRAMVVQAAQDAAERDENTLVVTFVKRDYDLIRAFRESLTDAGLDADDLINGKPRVMFTTWGLHDSFNYAKHCATVVLAGTYHLPEEVTAAAIIGQRDKLLAPHIEDDYRRVMNGQIACDVLQAMGRGTCRTVRLGEAMPMTVYWSTENPGPFRAITEVTPGMTWEPWWPAAAEDLGTLKFRAYRLLFDNLKSLDGSEPLTTAQVLAGLDLTLDGKPASKKTIDGALSLLAERPPKGWSRVGTTKASRWTLSI